MIDRIRFRSEGTMLVIQVEEDGPYLYHDSIGNHGKANWRDAKIEDALEIAPFFNSSHVSAKLSNDILERLSFIENYIEDDLK